MDTDLAPIDIAHHWPFVRRNLHLERWPAASRALEALAASQLDSGGQAVTFGTAYWRERGLTPGEIGATIRTLRDLERRSVVWGYDGGGRRGHSWSFVPSIVHWRAMPWSGRGRSVESAIRACACRAPRAVVALVPAQRGGLSRSKGEFRLSASDHLFRPGLLPVDVRDYGARCATTARHPGLSPVDVRDYGAGAVAPYCASKSLIEEEERELRSQGEARLVHAVMNVTGQLVSGGLRERLRGVVARAIDTDRLDEMVVLAGACGGMHAGGAVTALEECIAGPRLGVGLELTEDQLARRRLEAELALQRSLADPDVDRIAEIEATLATMGT